MKKSKIAKLKAENHKLWQDIYQIVGSPDSAETIIIIAKYKMQLNLENLIWKTPYYKLNGSSKDSAETNSWD